MRCAALTSTFLASIAVVNGKPLKPHLETRQVENAAGYVFVYFTGSDEGGESIFLAASEGNNALSWTELNGGESVLTSSFGTLGLRDPFLMRSHEGDKFFLIATDLKIADSDWDAATRNGSLHLEIWETADLIDWSEQRHVQVSTHTAGNTWAPEAYFDDELGKYVVFWASAIYSEDDPDHEGPSYQRMMYATTSDFVQFSEPVVWQDLDRIDSTVIMEGDTFHRFTKDEGGRGTGCVDIIQERSTSLRAPVDEWEVVTECIGANVGLEAVEGPAIFRSNPDDVNGQKFYLFVDEFGGRGYIPLEADDIDNPDWKVSGEYNLPGNSPRHGSVVALTAAELEGITRAYN